MASGFFAILDDIASLMDDVAATSKMATHKTAGILGDDLAVNAEKATGFVSSRELPVLWAITKGSFINKLIIIPIALLLNVFLPVAVKVILVLGGFYLAYEGVEKIVEFLFHRKKPEHGKPVANAEESGTSTEKTKIRSAIITDFILSIEIVIIALSTVLEESLLIQVLTVSLTAIVATVGVYGIVALIVRMDDLGYRLLKRSGNKGFLAKTGNLLVKALPLVIKSLAVVGTFALILVSGGIFIHNIDALHHLLPALPSLVREAAAGLLAGIIALGLITAVKKLVSLFRRNTQKNS